MKDNHGLTNYIDIIINYKLIHMSLEQKIMTELKTAMLAKDEAGLRSLRAIKAASLWLKLQKEPKAKYRRMTK